MIWLASTLYFHQKYCTLERIQIKGSISTAIIKNSVNNILEIPLSVFETWFNEEIKPTK